MQWTHGRIVRHSFLGRRKIWRTKPARYSVSRALDYGEMPFVAVDYAASDSGVLIGAKRTLRAAQRLCETHERGAR